ncbi:MAG: histidine kinase [Myxococcales bacterium]|nr:histidine kinase [Myxococcales bacterium]
MPIAIGSWGVAGLFAALTVLVYVVMRSRLSRAMEAERLAVERRDRFYAVAAQELDAPLVTLRTEVAGLDTWSATPDRIIGLTREVDQLRELVSELARVPAPVNDSDRGEVDVAELVREIIALPPFSDRGPSVIVRAAPTLVWADRARLSTGLRVLLWVVRRDVGPSESLLVTVSADEDAAYVEIDSGGGGEIAEALDQLPAVGYGLTSPTGTPGTTLALQVASQVARAHGGRLSASARVGQGERFVLELPRGSMRH